jgi:hypothetical protein
MDRNHENLRIETSYLLSASMLNRTFKSAIPSLQSSFCKTHHIISNIFLNVDTYKDVEPMPEQLEVCKDLGIEIRVL